MAISIKRIISKNTILKNFSVLTISNALTQFLSIFASIKIARSLNPSLFGTYNLLQLHVSIFVIIASLGLKNIIIRNIARSKTIANKVFYTALILRAIGFILSIAIFLAYFLLYRQYEILLFVLIVQCILSTIFFDLLEGIAFGLEKMEFSGIINLASTLCWLTTILVIPKTRLSLPIIFGLFVFFNSLKTIAYFISIYKAGYIKPYKIGTTTNNQIIGFFKESFPFYYLGLLTLLSNQIPLLFLEYRSGVAQIGFFNIASKVLMPINLVINTALAAIFPNLSRRFISDYESFIKHVKLILTFITIFCIGGAFGIALFRQEIIHLLYGAAYSNSSLVLGYQCWYVAIYSVVCLIGTILSAINRQKELGYLSILCTVIQVPILWYGSKYGAQYLSAAFLIATIIILIIHLFVINSYLKKKISLVFFVKVLGSFIVAYWCSLLLSEKCNTLLKAIIFGIIAVISGYIIFRKYKKNIFSLLTK